MKELKVDRERAENKSELEVMKPSAGQVDRKRVGKESEPEGEEAEGDEGKPT